MNIIEATKCGAIFVGPDGKRYRVENSCLKTYSIAEGTWKQFYPGASFLISKSFEIEKNPPKTVGLTLAQIEHALFLSGLDPSDSQMKCVTKVLGFTE